MSSFTLFDIYRTIELLGKLDRIIRPQIDAILYHRGYDLHRMSGIDIDWSTTFESEGGLIVEWEDYCGRGCYCLEGCSSATIDWTELFGEGTDFQLEDVEARADQIVQQYTTDRKLEEEEVTRKDREARLEKAKHEYESLKNRIEMLEEFKKEEN